MPNKTNWHSIHKESTFFFPAFLKTQHSIFIIQRKLETWNPFIQIAQKTLKRYKLSLKSCILKENNSDPSLLTESWNELSRLMNMKYTNLSTTKLLHTPTQQAHSFLHRLSNRHVYLVTTTTTTSFFKNLRQLGTSGRRAKPTSETHRRWEPRSGFAGRAVMRRMWMLHELHRRLKGQVAPVKAELGFGYCRVGLWSRWEVHVVVVWVRF